MCRDELLSFAQPSRPVRPSYLASNLRSCIIYTHTPLVFPFSSSRLSPSLPSIAYRGPFRFFSLQKRNPLIRRKKHPTFLLSDMHCFTPPSPLMPISSLRLVRIRFTSSGACGLVGVHPFCQRRSRGKRGGFLHCTDRKRVGQNT